LADSARVLRPCFIRRHKPSSLYWKTVAPQGGWMVGTFLVGDIMYMLTVIGDVFTISFTDEDMQKLIAITLDRGGDMSDMLIQLLTEKLDAEYEDL